VFEFRAVKKVFMVLFTILNGQNGCCLSHLSHSHSKAAGFISYFKTISRYYIGYHRLPSEVTATAEVIFGKSDDCTKKNH
jgi:hypothetical protein